MNRRRDDPGGQDQPDELGRRDRSRRRSPRSRAFEVEDLLVEERAEDRQPDERDREERQRVEDAAQRADVPADPPRLGVGRRRDLGRDGVRVGAHRLAFEVTAVRLAQEQGEDHEDRGRDDEHDERDPPAEPGRQEPRDERAEARTDGERGPVHRVHLRPDAGCRSSRRATSCAGRLLTAVPKLEPARAITRISTDGGEPGHHREERPTRSRHRSRSAGA